MDRFEVGKKIAEIRKIKRFTQVDLAIKTGLDKGHIARIELGKYSVGVDTLKKICDALGVKMAIVDRNK